MTESNVIVALENNTFETERQEALKVFLQNEGDQSLEEFSPGTKGCHELLDRTAMVSDLLERCILSHPACLQNPKWYILARQAADALHNLYQQVGTVHLEK
ncbi:MAG: hypothetical protein AB4426_35665 [Xenococcaceae cyanobacterium]